MRQRLLPSASLQVLLQVKEAVKLAEEVEELPEEEAQELFASISSSSKVNLSRLRVSPLS